MDIVHGTDEIRPLLEAASPAVLTTCRPDGRAQVSPVWFRVNGDAFEVVIAAGDRKPAYLERDPRCVLLVFETTPPFRGVEVRAEATLGTDGVAEARLAIASRYLGADQGRRFAEQRGDRGFVLRLPVGHARTWDLRAILPS
jgi:PPOX class probable F420-dependent enzyme